MDGANIKANNGAYLIPGVMNTQGSGYRGQLNTRSDYENLYCVLDLSLGAL